MKRTVTDEKGFLASLVDFSQLKFRERDDLEFTLNFWRQDDKKKFDIQALWDARLRTHYANRYDSRDNLVDWDYHMKFIVKNLNVRSDEVQLNNI